MPDAPPPPGGTHSSRENKVRWIEPIEPIFIEPVPSASRAGSGAARDATRWRDVSWIDFSAPEPTRPESRDQTWTVTRIVEPEDADDRWRDGEPTRAQPFDGTPAAETVAFIMEKADVRPARSAARGSRGRAALHRIALRGIGAIRLNRVAQFCVGAGALAAILGLSYEGGERLAGLAGAMTSPQNSAPRLPTPQPATPPLVKPAPLDEAGVRAAALLERANSGDLAAQYKIAVLYARGEGLVQDFTSASAWFQKAATNGNPAAQFNLGVLYQRGLGVTQDATEAVRWYKRSAERHYAPAAYNLAIAYAEGQGTPRDPVAAARWYHQAAVQGLVQAMINFAILYEKGEGVAASPAEAYAWYRAAAQRGDAVAEKRAGELLAGFDANLRKQAQSVAANIAAAIRQTGVELPGAGAGAGADQQTARN